MKKREKGRQKKNRYLAPTDRGQWPEVDKGFKCYPPNMKKREKGRQKKNRYLAPTKRSGKATRQVKYPGCGEYGHRSGSWRCSLTGTKKRKRTKKTAPKPGRKKAKIDPTPTGEDTPRTRMAVAREAAAKAAKVAREAAAAAAEKEMLDVAQIEIEHVPSSPPTSTRRSLCWDLQVVPEPDETTTPLVDPSVKKMTPKRKMLATKKKKSPAKKGKK